MMLMAVCEEQCRNSRSGEKGRRTQNLCWDGYATCRTLDWTVALD